MTSLSNTKAKKQTKLEGIGGLRLGTDYLDVSYMFNRLSAYAPLNHRASKLIASSHIGNCEGEWCTASNNADYWNKYTSGGIVLIYAVDYDREEKYGIALGIEDQEAEMFDARDDSIYDLPHNDIKHIMTRYYGDLEKIKDSYVSTLPDWVKKAKTKNLKWHYGNGGTFVMDNGEWISGEWDGGIFMNGIWHDGIWKLGVFNGGVWKAGTWEYGTWRGGTWEGGKWIRGTWAGGKDKDGYPHMMSPDKWEIEGEIGEEFIKYFDTPLSFHAKMFNDKAPEIKLLLDYAKHGAISPTIGKRISLAFEHNTKLVISNAYIKTFSYHGTSIEFDKCVIDYAEIPESFISLSEIHGGKYRIWPASLFRCKITGGEFDIAENKIDLSLRGNEISGGFFYDSKFTGRNYKDLKGAFIKGAIFKDLSPEFNNVDRCRFDNCSISGHWNPMTISNSFIDKSCTFPSKEEGLTLINTTIEK